MQHVGKIIRIKNRFPGPPTLVVNTVGEGLRKHLNLCFSCSCFHPDQLDVHCPIAQQTFEFSKTNSVSFALVRCAAFTPKPGVEVSDNSESQG